MLVDTWWGTEAAVVPAAVGAVAGQAGAVSVRPVHAEPVPPDHLRNHRIDGDYGAHVCIASRWVRVGWTNPNPAPPSARAVRRAEAGRRIRPGAGRRPP